MGVVMLLSRITGCHGKALIMAVGLVVAGGLAPAGVAQAESQETTPSSSPAVMAPASQQQCPDSRVCLFDSTDYVGLLGFRVPGQGLADLSAANDNRMESWINRTSTHAAWYDDRNGGGTCNEMYPLTGKSDVGFFARNGASSMRTDRGCH